MAESGTTHKCTIAITTTVQTELLVNIIFAWCLICSENAVGGILNWWISALYGEKPMLVV